MNYEQVKRAVAVMRRSLKNESFEDFRDFFRALGDVEDAYDYRYLEDGKDDEDFLQEVMHTCNEFGYADHVEESIKQNNRKLLKEDMFDDFFDDFDDLIVALRAKGFRDISNIVKDAFGELSGEGDNKPKLTRISDTKEILYKAYGLLDTKDDNIEVSNMFTNLFKKLSKYQRQFESKKSNRKTSRIEESGMDEAHAIVALDELIKDMESAGVTDFADDLNSINQAIYDYGISDRENCESLYRLHKEMVHTRDPLILDYARQLMHIVGPYIRITAKYIENKNEAFNEEAKEVKHTPKGKRSATLDANYHYKNTDLGIVIKQLNDTFDLYYERAKEDEFIPLVKDKSFIKACKMLRSAIDELDDVDFGATLEDAVRDVSAAADAFADLGYEEFANEIQNILWPLKHKTSKKNETAERNFDEQAIEDALVAVQAIDSLPKTYSRKLELLINSLSLPNTDISRTVAKIDDVADELFEKGFTDAAEEVWDAVASLRQL